MEDLYTDLIKILPEEKVLRNELMSKHTSFKIGGCADYFVRIDSEDELKNILKICNDKNIKFFIIGNGTNLLFKDDGFDGIVVKFDNKECKIEKIDNDEIIYNVGAGMSLIEMAYNMAKLGYSGLEFASGIPGTIGGAVRMNAGAYGREMKDILISSKCMDYYGNIVELSNAEHQFEYRNSIFSKRKLIILSSKLKMIKGKIDDIKNTMNEYLQKRKSSQPIGYPSAGSVFKRNEKFLTAKLIDECGLKGYRIGGAEVSEKHAGFIINIGNATAQDVIKLIDVIKKEIKNKFDEDIELEMQIIGGKEK